MDKQKLKELRQKAQLLNPLVRIGKNGLTGAQLEEINKHLKKKKLVKIKILKSLIEQGAKKDAVAKEICERTGTILVQRIGFVVTIYREK